MIYGYCYKYLSTWNKKKHILFISILDDDAADTPIDLAETLTSVKNNRNRKSLSLVNNIENAL